MGSGIFTMYYWGILGWTSELKCTLSDLNECFRCVIQKEEAAFHGCELLREPSSRRTLQTKQLAFP
jgi:hypothetical protein